MHEGSHFRPGDLTLAILAGGRGRRLGGATKGLIVVDGEPVLARLMRLARLVERVLLVTNDAAPYASFSLETVPDVIPERGAPGGVLTALEHAHTEWVFVVACDMPFVDRAAVELLCAQRTDDAEVVCFEVDGRCEPMVALYRRSLAERWRAALADGASSLRDLIAAARTLRLSERALREVDPDLRTFENLNRPEDLLRLGASRPDERR